MGFLNQIIALKAAGVGFLSIFCFLVWAYRVVMAYCKETRDEYRSRLHAAVLELERQKTINIRLELRIQTLELLNSLSKPLD